MKKITNYLQELGLTEIEAKIYQGLLEIGPSTVKDLAQHIGTKRITTHFNVESLIEKGLVTQTTVGARRQIMAEGPEKLEYLITQKEREVRRIRDEFSIITKDLSSSLLHSQAGEHVQVKYYEGKDAVSLIYKEVLNAKKIYSFANINQIRKIFPQNTGLFKNAIDADSKKEIWEIFEASKETREYVDKANKRYHYCFFPENVSFSNFDFMIFDDSVAMVYLHPEKPYAIISHSPAMAAGLRAVHQILWRVLSAKDY